MENKLTSEDYESIKELVENALMAPNKRETEVHINKLKYYENKLSASSRNIFSELVSYLKTSSGRVPDKENKVKTTMDFLYKVQLFCIED